VIFIVLEPGRPAVDTGNVTLRSLGLVSLLVAVAIGGWLFFAQARETGPTSDFGERAQEEASVHVAGTNLQSAAPILQAHHAQAGTYAGAVVPPNLGVVLVRADATSYCLQAGTGLALQHVVGPGGTPTAGPC
jgi:hypothetical protein